MSWSPPRLDRTTIPVRNAGLVVIAVHLVVVLTSVAAVAQVPSRLTLEDAMRIAMGGNAQYLQTANNVESASAGVKSAWGALLPSVNLNAVFSSTYSETQTAIDEFGQPLSQPRAIITKTSRSSQSIGLGSVTLFDGGRQFRDIDIARLNADVARIGVTDQENTLRAVLTRQYFQVVNAADRIELERQLLENARERLDLIEQRFRIAAADQTDLLGAELEVARSEQSLAEAEANVRRLRLDLLETMGVRGEPVFAMTSVMPPVFDPAVLDVEALAERALASHPTMRLGSINMDLSEKQLANARAQRLPTLSLGLPSYSFGETERGLFDAWGKFGAPNNSFSFNLGVSYPLFDGFSRSANIANSREAEQDRRYALEQTRLQVEKNVRTAMIDLELRHGNLLIAQQAADNAQLRLDLAQEQYRLGAVDFTILQQIVQQNDDARRQVLDAQLQFLNARVTLEEAIGVPLDANQ